METTAAETTRGVDGVTVPVRPKARKADYFAYGWHGYYFYTDYRTGGWFAVAKS